jgi:hypothetical protein
MHESPAAISSSIRSFQNHTREYIPNITAAASSLIDVFKSTHKLRQEVAIQSQTYLQRLSSAQEHMVSIGPQLTEADELFGQSQEGYDLLHEVENLAENYGEGLLEGFRRGLWKIRCANRLEKAREDIALLRVQEIHARKTWDDNGSVWTFVDDISDDESPIPNGIDSPVNRKHIETYISAISKSPLFENIAMSLKDHLSVLISTPQDAAPLQLTTEDLPSVKTREGSQVYEDLLREKTRAEERARNFESRVKNLEELLHRQFRSPPRIFSPLPSHPTSPQIDDLERSVADINVLQNRVNELENEKREMIDRFTETEGTKSDLMANLEEQTKLFQAEREDMVRKTHELEREVERCESEINQLVPKMEGEMDTLRKGRQNLLREMNLLQTETGAKIKELEDAKTAAVVAEREAAAETLRITGELRRVTEDATERSRQIESNAKEMVATVEAEKVAAAQEHSDEVTAIQEEFSTFCNRLAETFAVENSPESLLHAAKQLAANQRVTEVVFRISNLVPIRRIQTSHRPTRQVKSTVRLTNTQSPRPHTTPIHTTHSLQTTPRIHRSTNQILQRLRPL